MFMISIFGQRDDFGFQRTTCRRWRNQFDAGEEVSAFFINPDIDTLIGKL
jgi:hypothetical protein